MSDVSGILIPHFKKEWKSGARMGAHSIMGSFEGKGGGGHARICFKPRAP